MYNEIRKYGSIYKLTNIDNNKIYFGQTTNIARDIVNKGVETKESQSILNLKYSDE